MALIWEKTQGDTHYEVRRAGHSIRLYSNGVFHSQWNPNKHFSGHLWDLLALPAFFHTGRGKALMLGVGGGAAINALSRSREFTHIIGVDLDSVHLNIARRFFHCHHPKIELIHAEAKHFIRSEKRHFNYLVDDLFLGGDKHSPDARRAIAPEKTWLKSLCQRLTSQGTLTINCEGRSQAIHALETLAQSPGIQAIYFLQSKRYENVVITALKKEGHLDVLQENLSHYTGNTHAKRLLNDFRIERFF